MDKNCQKKRSKLRQAISTASRHTILQNGTYKQGKWIWKIVLWESKQSISDPKFQTSLFSKTTDFFHIQGEIHYNKLPIPQFPQKQYIFGKKDNFWLLRINFRWRKLIQASVSGKSFKFWFSRVLVHFSMWHGITFFFAIIICYSSGFICFISIYWNENPEILS